MYDAKPWPNVISLSQPPHLPPSPKIQKCNKTFCQPTKFPCHSFSCTLSYVFMMCLIMKSSSKRLKVTHSEKVLWTKWPKISFRNETDPTPTIATGFLSLSRLSRRSHSLKYFDSREFHASSQKLQSRAETGRKSLTLMAHRVWNEMKRRYVVHAKYKLLSPRIYVTYGETNFPFVSSVPHNWAYLG